MADAPSRLSISAQALDSLPPERLFDFRWATTVVEQALRRLREECEGKDRLRLFYALSPHLTEDRDEISYTDLAATLGVPETAVKKQLHTMRQRYRSLLRDEVAHTVAIPADVEDEIRYLCAALAAANRVTAMENPDGFTGSVPSSSNSPGKCEKCGATIDSTLEFARLPFARGTREAVDEVSRAAFESVIAEVDVPDRQWRLGNYEILDEIGRGGMGVIYRARQRHSRRIVALKRVLNYQADSHETLMRFRREAEAAASLDHPNILPIYEVSESEDGLPFFSMKFATGGSLARRGAALRNEPRNVCS